MQKELLETKTVRQLQNNPIIKNLIKSNQGFTIIEILVALVLMSLVFALAISDPFSNSEDLDKQSNDLERAVRFMSDEATLRNSVVRLHFMLNKEPQEYAVEYGPTDNFVLPPEPEFETVVVTKEEEEKLAKQNKELNMKFNKVQEFQESNAEIYESVKVIGIGNASSNKLKTSGDMSIYAFPSGEKDDALIILANEQSVITLEINPFNRKIDKKTQKLELKETSDLTEVQAAKAKEIFELWMKDR